ncbi:hypothetical protein P7C70_g2135, partial [Phenoliferia sp. Uapishka_3]
MSSSQIPAAFSTTSPPAPPPRSLNVIASSWLPTSSASLDGELLQDFYLGHDQDQTTDFTPPLTPSQPLASSFSTPLRTPTKWVPTTPATPPSESTLRFLQSARAAEPPRESLSVLYLHDGRVYQRRGSFDPVVGSPPRGPRQSTSTSVPVTPTSQEVAGAVAGTKALWTWPRRGERLVGSALVIEAPVPKLPAQEVVLSFDALVGRKVDLDAQDILSTRYVKVEGVPRQSTNEDLHNLLSTRVAGIRAFCVSKLRSDGTVVVVFFDVRDAVKSMTTIRSMTVATSFAPLRAVCVTRQDLRELHSGDFSPLVSDSEGVLVVSLRGAPLGFSPLDLLAGYALRQYKAVDSNTFVFEFWDDRSAVLAADKLDNYYLPDGCRIYHSYEPEVATTRSEFKRAVTPSPSKGPEVKTAVSPPSTPLRAQAAPFQYNIKPAPAHVPTPMLTPPASPLSMRPGKPFEPIINASWTGQPPPFRTASPQVFKHQRRSSGKGASTVHLKANDPDWGIYRDDKIPARNVLNLDRVRKGLDVRTSLMIKNVPTRMTDTALMAFIDAAVGRCYDFLYLRMDFASEYNVGYGFVNFVSPAALLAFASARLGTRWNSYHSNKLLVASYGNVQGKENLIEKFKNSAVMLECEEFRPKIFYTSGPKAGQQEPFPESDDPHRIARSAANILQVGLFPASKPIFKIGQALPSPANI